MQQVSGHIHIPLGKLSNAASTHARLLRWIETAQTSTQLTVGHGRSCKNVFTRQTPRALINPNSS